MTAALTYTDVKRWLDGQIKADDSTYPTPPSGQGTFTAINPGPASDQDLQITNPGPVIFLTLGGGPGLTNEYLFDGVFIEVNVIGDQGDPEIGYASAEAIALWVDGQLLAFDHSGLDVNGILVTHISRAGGRPQLVGRVAGRRYHFQCSYIAEADSGL